MLIKHFKALIKKKTNKTTKYVWTNGSIKFYSELLNEFYTKEGTTRHCTCANEPQQVAQLMSRTLLEMIYKMLYNAGIAKIFLEKTLNTMSYLMNGSPSIVVGCQTLKKVWSGEVTDYFVFRIFNCSCYVRVSDDKLNKREKKHILLSYT